MKRIARPLLLTALAGLVGLVGCSSEGEPSGNTVLVTAAQGGSVTMDGDETAIHIPALALAADTEIGIAYDALSNYAALEDGLARVVVFEPAGTTLTQPATVLVDPGFVIGADKVVSVRQWADGGWYGTQSAEVVSGGLVSTSVTYLAPLAIVVEDAPVGPTGGVSGSVLHFYTEEPLEGITFELMQGSTVIDTTVSDVGGLYSFTEVPVGTYTVHADVDPVDNCYGDATDKEAVVVENETTDVWFGFVPGPC